MDAEVLPADLKFRFQLNKQLLGTITIKNPHDKRLAYKIKTTAPKKYVVRPSSGIADPGASVSVQVIMQAQKEYPPDFANCKDKFMVQTALLVEGDDVDKDTFTKDGRGLEMKEARLRVILEGPAAPPSPVPEVNEGADGDEGGAGAAGGPSSRGADGAAAPYQIEGSRLKNTLGELSAVSSENSGLKAQLEGVTRDRDELRRRLDQAAASGKAGGGGGGGAVAHGETGAKPSVTFWHLILVAIISYLLGHFT